MNLKIYLMWLSNGSMCDMKEKDDSDVFHLSKQVDGEISYEIAEHQRRSGYERKRTQIFDFRHVKFGMPVRHPRGDVSMQKYKYGIQMIYGDQRETFLPLAEIYVFKVMTLDYNRSEYRQGGGVQD